MNYNFLHILQTDFNEHNLIPVRPFSTNMMHSFIASSRYLFCICMALSFPIGLQYDLSGESGAFSPLLPLLFFFLFDTKNILFSRWIELLRLCKGLYDVPKISLFFVLTMRKLKKYTCDTRPFGSMIKSCATHIFRWPHKLGLIGLAENDMKPYLNSKISSKGGRRDALSHFSTDEIW